jgi:hypothetical protein
LRFRFLANERKEFPNRHHISAGAVYKKEATACPSTARRSCIVSSQNSFLIGKSQMTPLAWAARLAVIV